MKGLAEELRHSESRHVARPALVDATVLAYAEWRAACTVVRHAYRTCGRAEAVHADPAHRAYSAALDREQAAAEAYAGFMRKVGDLVESGLDYPLSGTSSMSEAR
jgi:hypothetical protein